VALTCDTHACECGTYTAGAHRIALVRTDTGAAITLAEGTGVGAVRLNSAGAMFVQRDRRAYRWGPAGPTETLPPGVLLVSPVPESSAPCRGF
jgi:hypothetical protein